MTQLDRYLAHQALCDAATAQAKPKPRTKENMESPHQELPKGTFKKMPLLSADELAFYNIIAKAIDEKHAIFTKVPLTNIIYPSLLADKSFMEFEEIEYLICDKTTSLPICILAIDFPSNPTPLEYFLNVSGIAVIRLDNEITDKELQHQIANAQANTAMKYPEEVTDVPVSVIMYPTVGKIQKPLASKRRHFPKVVTVLGTTPREKIITFWHNTAWAIFAGIFAYIGLTILHMLFFTRSPF